MKILFATPYFVFPANNGGKRRSYSLIKEIAKECDIDLLTLYRADDDHDLLKKEMSKYCENIFTFERLPGKNLKNYLNALFSLEPIQSIVYFSKKMEEFLKENHKNYDIIYVETYYMYKNFERIKTEKPIVLCWHNVDSLLHHRLLNQIKNPIMKLAIWLDVKKQSRKEKYLLEKSKYNIGVSHDDINFFNKISNKTFFYSPNGVATEDFSSQKNIEENTLLFVGDFGAIANELSIIHFFKNILPYVKSNVKINIVGPRITKNMEKFSNDNRITFKGFVPNVVDEYFSNEIFIAPIIFGSGTKLKLLEAMAASMPIVTTTIGAEGIALKNKENSLICDNDKDFAKAIDELLNDKIAAKSLGKNARICTENNYDWKKISRDLVNYFKLILKEKVND